MDGGADRWVLGRALKNLAKRRAPPVPGTCCTFNKHVRKVLVLKKKNRRVKANGYKNV